MSPSTVSRDHFAGTITSEAPSDFVRKSRPRTRRPSSAASRQVRDRVEYLAKIARSYELVSELEEQWLNYRSLSDRLADLAAINRRQSARLARTAYRPLEHGEKGLMVLIPLASTDEARDLVTCDITRHGRALDSLVSGDESDPDTIRIALLALGETAMTFEDQLSASKGETMLDIIKVARELESLVTAETGAEK
jgi:hypothetical protein